MGHGTHKQMAFQGVRSLLSRASARGMATRTPIVGGSWKCNPASISQLDELVANINMCDTSKCEVFVCPSPLHVGLVYDKFTGGAKVCPQNCNFTGTGAYTGEMAVDQMKDMGMEWVLIGHSERRGEFGVPTPAESSELLATKLSYVLEHCAKQLQPCVPFLDPARVVIAYEPVWAIGTGVTASPEQAQETHKLIRGWLAENVSQECADGMRIQYGGSANAANAPELSAMPDVDGFLVGGAALKPEFAQIVAAISEAKSA